MTQEMRRRNKQLKKRIQKNRKGEAWRANTPLIVRLYPFFRFLSVTGSVLAICKFVVFLLPLRSSFDLSCSSFFPLSLSLHSLPVVSLFLLFSSFCSFRAFMQPQRQHCLADQLAALSDTILRGLCLSCFVFLLISSPFFLLVAQI